MAKPTSAPDPQILVEQILKAAAQGGYWSVRGNWLPQAGFGLLMAAGLKRKRAKAVMLMARRTAASWRHAGEPVSDADVAATAKRLLL